MSVCLDPAVTEAANRHGAIALLHAITMLSQRLRLTPADTTTLSAVLHGSGGADELDISAPRIGVLLGLTLSAAVYRMPSARRTAIVGAVGKRVSRLRSRLVDMTGTSLLGYTPGARHGHIRTVSRYDLRRIWAILGDLGDAGSDPARLARTWEAHNISTRQPRRQKRQPDPWRGVPGGPLPGYRAFRIVTARVAEHQP